MKKLLGIVVLGLLWCNVGFADSPFIFFGIELGSNADKYTNAKLEKSFDDNHSANKYSFKPPKNKTNDLFSKYTFKTSAVSNSVVDIYAEGPYIHSKEVCQQKMFVLRKKVIDLKKKLFSDKYKIVKSTNFWTNDSFFHIEISDLNAPEDITDIRLVCWVNADISRWKAYIWIRSDSLDELRRKQHMTHKMESVNTKGF